jgi:polygalacturonase
MTSGTNPGWRFSSSRRRVLNMLGLSTFPLLAGKGLSLAYAAIGNDEDPWRAAEAILQRIQPPAFPDRAFDITGFGAVGDGRTDCTGAIRQAIQACAAAGGGRVVVPSGRFLTGAIQLESNVDLHLSNTDSVLAFSTDPKAYLPVVLTRWEGNDCYNHAPLVYAFGKENIAITGKGTLDGQASRENWWPWKGSPNGAGRRGSRARRQPAPGFASRAEPPRGRGRAASPRTLSRRGSTATAGICGRASSSPTAAGMR